MDRENATVKALEQQGWVRQFVANEPRLSEAIQMYREAGFEVHLEPLPPQPKQPAEEKFDLDTDCRQCFEGFEDRHKIIFTRAGEKNTDRLEDDLF